VTFKVLRDGKEQTFSTEIGELREEEAAKPLDSVQKQLGISLQPVTPEIAAELGMKRAEGVIVTNVEPNSLASEAGFQRGDVILEVDRTPVNNLQDFSETIRKADKTILFLLYRNGSTFYISIKSSQKEG